MDKAQTVVQNFLEKREIKASKYIDILEDMLGDFDSYHFAETTLLGIYEFVEENGYITDNQIEAIQNIREKLNERYEW